MPYLQYDLNPVTHITIDTVGPPGQRTFFLQASQGLTLVSLIIEKEHAYALAIAIRQLLEQLGEDLSELVTTGVDLELKEPLVPAFRVGQLGLGYDDTEDLLVVVAQELTEEEEEEMAAVARFWATRRQMGALSEHALQVVAAGRPICPLCGEPMDPDNPEGHICPRKNGRRGGSG
ncbi:MAG: DUF3090 family protein [Chloroflexi bacterium]|nr:MAG: DUF3090 family protein [Chloroflexota bacterium]